MENALCLEPGFRGFLARALSQEGEAAADGEGEGDAAAAAAAGRGAAAAVDDEESCKLRSKAAFVLKVSGVLPFRLGGIGRKEGVAVWFCRTCV